MKVKKSVFTEMALVLSVSGLIWVHQVDVSGGKFWLYGGVKPAALKRELRHSHIDGF